MTTAETLPLAEGFAALGLSEPTLRGISALGYTNPTPIQEQTISRMLAGADLIAQAQTGTGKTAAFALPILEQIDPLIRVPQALIMAPTRELAIQVKDAFIAYAANQTIAVVAVYGGQPIGFQLGALRRGAQIIVGTPGRLLDHIRRGTLDLTNIRTVVLDEADVMLDMGFIEDIETILGGTPAERQTALFSATMPEPIARLARTHMREPEQVVVKALQMTAEAVEQSYYEVGPRDKFDVLARILEFERPASAIIFCRTKRDVDTIGERLLARGMPAETLHGDLSQIQRDRVMGRFRSNQVVLLVATDVAARGLDVEQISHVVNFDMPTDPETYVHRIGRTARAGRSGNAITLVNNREIRQIQQIERMVKAKIVRKRVPTIQEVADRRNGQIVEQIRTQIENDETQPYAQLAAQLSAEFTPEQIAAAALRLLLGEPVNPAEDRLAQLEPSLLADRQDRSGPPRGRSFERGGFAERGRGAPERGPGGPDRGPDRGMTRIFLEVGRQDGVRPADIVGAIANETGLPGRSIGAIQLFDRTTTVELPSNAAERVVRALRNTVVRGVPVGASFDGRRR